MPCGARTRKAARTTGSVFRHRVSRLHGNSGVDYGRVQHDVCGDRRTVRGAEEPAAGRGHGAGGVGGLAGAAVRHFLAQSGSTGLPWSQCSRAKPMVWWNRLRLVMESRTRRAQSGDDDGGTGLRHAVAGCNGRFEARVNLVISVRTLLPAEAMQPATACRKPVPPSSSPDCRASACGLPSLDEADSTRPSAWLDCTETRAGRCSALRPGMTHGRAGKPTHPRLHHDTSGGRLLSSANCASISATSCCTLSIIHAGISM